MKQLAFATPKPEKQTVLRVRFDAAGNVSGIDKAGLDKIADISPKSGKTQTLGRDRTLLEDIFGNIARSRCGWTGRQQPWRQYWPERKLNQAPGPRAFVRKKECSPAPLI